VIDKNEQDRDLSVGVSSKGVSRLVLASHSPRRRALLAGLGVLFEVDAADVDETPLPDELPDALACRLCQSKAAAVAARHPEAAILAADTMVALDDTLLGKPVDADEAAAMLRLLRGRTHQVYTAVCMAHDGGLVARLSISDVTMRLYSDAEIAAYVATGDPLDKAGAYAIQHALFAPVAAWTGCYASIMGLPLRLVGEMLAKAGLNASIAITTACGRLNGGKCCASND
jgi:septum formation protein